MTGSLIIRQVTESGPNNPAGPGQAPAPAPGSPVSSGTAVLPCRSPLARFLLEPAEVRRGSGHNGRCDYLRLIVTVPLREELGQFLVTVGGQLEDKHPLLGPLQPVIPPVRARDRAGHLSARG